MSRVWSAFPLLGASASVITLELLAEAPVWRAVLCLAAAGAAGWGVTWLRRRQKASPVDGALAFFSLLAAVATVVWPALGRLLSLEPVPALYFTLLIMAAGPPLLGKEGFTTFFARRTTDEKYWQSEAFLTINRRLTWFWAGLFGLGFLLGLLPEALGLTGRLIRTVVSDLVPPALLLGLGWPATRWYPKHHLRSLGLDPALTQPSPSLSKPEEKIMPGQFKVVAVNGSPMEKFGNVGQMLDLLKTGLEAEGLAFEEIVLAEHRINYCLGCGWCLYKGACWQRDDHKALIRKIVEADAVILASPVYFRSVTGQMKVFLDRSLGLGHKPMMTFKPGLVVTVSAGWGETDVADYLTRIIGAYGAFALGSFTAIATGPGQFLGRELIEARAADLARDLSKALRDKRRRPPTDRDRDAWQFFQWMINNNKDFMQADYKHWRERGLLESFEKAFGVAWSESAAMDRPAYEAWVKSLMAKQERPEKAEVQTEEVKPVPDRDPFSSARCLIESMPRSFNPAAAGDLKAVIQFEIGGEENFTAHLTIDEGRCTALPGPADKADVIVQSPAQVWLAIAKGELNGQQAFMSGQFKAQGNLMLLMRLGELFKA